MAMELAKKKAEDVGIWTIEWITFYTCNLARRS